MKTYVVETGPCSVGHIFRADEIASKWVPLVVMYHARLTGADVHPSEARVWESRPWPSGTRSRLELRVADTLIATAVEDGA